ncbi:triose-phosphate transporter family-domain-containing protein [Amylocarpus encephaloides]|uniref:Triose-phosphate transporter family-domain-containing protein n=1 Tax=Amylocarpus encephaloides TaxID=45428 RepID=A0A9P8BZV8_9HELO|nr:triose-phosphate transporter family-domain-containing protein [Amylocarpus encephaloides]
MDDSPPQRKDQDNDRTAIYTLPYTSPISTSLPRHTFTRLPTVSASNEPTSNRIHAPDAAAALAGIRAPDRTMSEASGHRRRRSSLMNPLESNPVRNPRRTSKSPTKKDKIQEEPKVTDGMLDDDNRSTSEDLEMDDFSDDGLQDDEETGLTGKDRGKRKRRKRTNTLLDQRIAGDVTITAKEKKEADQYVFRNMVINCILIGLWYLFSLSISIYNKWMFSSDHLDFHFPLFTTCMHMLVQFSLASCVLYFIPSLRPRHDSLSNPNNTQTAESSSADYEAESKKPLMTRMFYFTRIGPCGVATGLDIGLGNMSLKFITLTFYTMCKSSSLAFVLMFAFLFRLEAPSWRLVAIIATMTAGVVMMVAGEVDFSAMGFTLVILAAFFSGFRWGLTQILLLRNPATSNPFSSIFFLAPVMFVSLFVLAVPLEGFPELFEGLRILMDAKGHVLGPLLLLFPGVIAFCMTASEFALLQRTSVVTLSIAGIFKEVVTISAAGLIFGDTLTPINISGLVVTIGAITAYNYIKIRKMREDAQMEAHGKNVNERGGGSGSEADGESDSSDEEDWNTIEGTIVTADGDIIRIPGTPSKHPKNVPESSKATSASAPTLAVRQSTERTRAEIAAVAASKKELSD